MFGIIFYFLYEFFIDLGKSWLAHCYDTCLRSMRSWVRIVMVFFFTGDSTVSENVFHEEEPWTDNYSTDYESGNFILSISHF